MTAYYEKTRAPQSREGKPGQPLPDREVPPVLRWWLDRLPWLRRHPHPMLSHFPIVFMLSASFFSFLYVVTGHRSFDDTAFYCLGAGLVTMIPAVLSGLFTHWLNFPRGQHRTVNIEIGLSFMVLIIGVITFFWHWKDPQVLAHLCGTGMLYFILILWGINIAMNSKDRFGSMIALGIVAYFIHG